MLLPCLQSQVSSDKDLSKLQQYRQIESILVSRLTDFFVVMTRQLQDFHSSLILSNIFPIIIKFNRHSNIQL